MNTDYMRVLFELRMAINHELDRTQLGELPSQELLQAMGAVHSARAKLSTPERPVSANSQVQRQEEETQHH